MRRSSELVYPGVDSRRRREQLAEILVTLRSVGSLSRSDLGRRIGVDRSTTASLIRQLESADLVEIAGPTPRLSAGRPSPRIVASASLAVLAIHLTRSYMSSSVHSVGGASAARSTREVGEGSTLEDVVITAVRDTARVGVPPIAIGIAIGRDSTCHPSSTSAITDKVASIRLQMLELGLPDIPIVMGDATCVQAAAELPRLSPRRRGTVLYVDGDHDRLSTALLIRGTAVPGAQLDVEIERDLHRAPMGLDATAPGLRAHDVAESLARGACLVRPDAILLEGIASSFYGAHPTVFETSFARYGWGAGEAPLRAATLGTDRSAVAVSEAALLRVLEVRTEGTEPSMRLQNSPGSVRSSA